MTFVKCVTLSHAAGATIVQFIDWLAASTEPSKDPAFERNLLCLATTDQAAADAQAWRLQPVVPLGNRVGNTLPGRPCYRNKDKLGPVLWGISDRKCEQGG